ncbi:MAG: hypothetical protein LQ346_008631 [Caloplaca aetnensis]|nr:MAG: hypothetical protein LQ346_008631 [Caloplaca aetnensis]
MAPLLNVLIQILPALPGTSRWSSRTETPSRHPALSSVKSPQQAILPPDTHTRAPARAPSIRGFYDQLSSVSWGENRVDVFRLVENNVSHKWWDGHQWNPANYALETLGNGLATPPVAISWGVDRLDVFGLDDHNVIKHQYWDGTAWRPHTHELENLGGACDSQYAISPTTWGKDRLDVFCVGLDGDLLHQYYDGSQWQPSTGSLESLGGELAGDPSVVSWGKDRLDIFCVTEGGDIAHLYYDGSQWSEWETFKNAAVVFQPDGITATSWGKDRLDIFGTSVDELGGRLYHIYWDGTRWSDFEKLDDENKLILPFGRASVTSWAPNRLDVVMKRTLGQLYYYKYYDGIGQAWRPSTTDWYVKSDRDSFTSNPTVVSWGENRLDIFGISHDELLHQAWTGSDWYPDATEWELLANSMEEDGGETGNVSGDRDEAVELRK